jgi:hypothetical protein
MGKYKYKRLPMGIKIAPDPYLDDLLILTNSSFKDHLPKLEMLLARLSTAGMRVNISQSKFFAEQIEYLAP